MPLVYGVESRLELNLRRFFGCRLRGMLTHMREATLGFSVRSAIS